MLSPYRVLDLTDERGQFASMLLAQLGAEVIVVEPVGGSRSRVLAPFDRKVAQGDPEASLVWRAWNRGKRSVCLDYETDPVDAERLLALVETADFLFDTHAPGALSRSGLATEVLQARNPRLIHVSITAFGQDGPKANWPATDLTVWAAAGPLALTGDADRAPVRVPGGQAFLHASAESVGAALAALHERHRSGRGQHIDVSAQQAAGIAAQVQTLCQPLGDVVTTRSGGGSVRGRIRNRYLFPASDGFVTVTFAFGGQVAAFTRRLLDWMDERGYGDERTRSIDVAAFAVRLAVDDDAVEEHARLQGLVASFTSTMTKAELFREALARKLLIGPVSTMDDVLASPQLAARAFFDTVEGDVFPGPFAKVAPVPLRRLGRAPRLDGDRDEVLGRVSAPKRTQASARSASPSPTTPPLAGLKVLDFTWSMAGPMVTRVLADYGATVVKVESATRPDNARALRPLRGGTGPSAAFGSFNAGKLGLGLNLSRADGRAVALDLTDWADVVVESFSPRAMRAWGLDYPALGARNPALIMLSSCLMGQDGPYSSYSAFGNTAASVAGFTNVTGWPDRAPAGPYSAYTDYVSPRLGVAALLAALDHRGRTGGGTYIDLSQIEASIHFLGPIVLDASVNGVGSLPAGNRDPNLVPHGVFPCGGEDRWVAVACENDSQWAALAELVGRPELGSMTYEARRSDEDRLEAAIASWTARLDADDAMRSCVNARIPAHVVQNSPECWSDPHLHARSHFRSVPTAPDGTLIIEGPRANFSRSAVAVERAGPAVGEDSWDVLTEMLGYSPERVTSLMIAGVVE